MDRISELSDELLLKILSSLPTAKDVVDTMVLSKRWQFLWMLVPKLVYDDSYKKIKHRKFSKFVDRSLALHEAPVIDTLRFKLGPTCGSGDIGVWIKSTVNRCVRELIVEIDCSSSTSPVILPRSVYKGCSMLVTLKLDNMTLMDVSSTVIFTTLKTLSLLSLQYPGDEFVKRLLSNCPVLENLVVDLCLNDNVTIFTVIVPSLKTLILGEASDRVPNEAYGFVIDTPSLECLDVVLYKSGFCVFENNMSKIVKANIDVNYWSSGKILGSITSVERLYLCLLDSQDVYPIDNVFDRLVHLKICTCASQWLNLLLSILSGSPKLRALKLKQCHPLEPSEPRPCWNEPSSVPECLSSSLETFEWIKYEGTEEEKETAAFIFRNGSCLKKVSISSKCTNVQKKFEMLKELSSSFRRSPTCQLTFE